MTMKSVCVCFFFFFWLYVFSCIYYLYIFLVVVLFNPVLSLRTFLHENLFFRPPGPHLIKNQTTHTYTHTGIQKSTIVSFLLVNVYTYHKDTMDLTIFQTKKRDTLLCFFTVSSISLSFSCSYNGFSLSYIPYLLRLQSYVSV